MVALSKGMRNPAPSISQDVTFRFVAQSHFGVYIWLLSHFHIIQFSRALKSRGIDTKCWWGCGATGTLTCCWWECETAQSLRKTVWWFLSKLNILLPCNPAVALLGICPNGLKTYIHSKTCTQMFRVTLFVIVKTWKQPRCPSAGEWINCGAPRQWNIIHAKKNELWSHEKTQRNLKCPLLSERSQSEKSP